MTKEEKLSRIRELELKLVDFHNSCVDENIVPQCFGHDWKHGMHNLQICLMVARLLIHEGEDHIYRIDQ